MSLEGAHILLIEDHVPLAENLQELLEGEGATVRVAHTAADGIAASREPFDVALVDVRLPDFSGIHVLQQLKAGEDPTIEVLLVTGNATLEDAIDAVGTGAYAYLLKPFHPDDLIHCMERAYGQVSLKREANALAVQLARGEANLRTLVNTVQALLLVLDEDGIVVQANPAVAATTGVPVQEIIGRAWLEEFVPVADRDGVNDIVDRLVAGEKNVSHDNRIIAFDDEGNLTERWVQWRSSPLRDATGKLLIYASGIDITETRELGLRTQVADRLAAAGTLTAGLAHEVRNPLNSARLQLHVLQRRLRHLRDDPKVWTPVELAIEEIDRLARLLKEFLEFARPTEIRGEPVDLRDLVTRVADFEQAVAEQRRVEIVKSVPDAPMMVTGDPDKLQQALLNIVQNAFDAVDDGGTIELRVASDANGCVLLSVKDNGPGIPEDDIPRIFEPFFSTKSSGTGLGMAIVHNLIDQHGGSISVRTNGGAEFTVTLPRRPD